MKSNFNCGCEYFASQSECDIEIITALRDTCSIVRDILVPDDLFPRYVNWIKAPGDSILSNPYVIGLLKKVGSVSSITTPLHYFLDERRDLHRSTLSLGQLADSWFLKSSREGREEAYRRKQGILAELRTAYWLAQNGWRLTGLEFLGGEFDVSGVSETTTADFEIKYLLRNPKLHDFNIQIIKTKAEMYFGQTPRPQHDYFLLRVYEAAAKLRQSRQSKIVVVVLYDFDDWASLHGQEIRWSFDFQDESISNLIYGNAGFVGQSHSEINSRLRLALQETDEIWILREGKSYDLELRRKLSLQP